MDQKYTNFITIKDNILKQREFAILNNAFRAAGIPMVPIKGMALLYELNRYAETRPMADIDIVVKRDDIERSKDILLSLNYKISEGHFSENYYRNQYHHLPFHGKYMVELHWNLSPPRPNTINLPELWKRVRYVKSGEDTIMLLSPEDTIFSLALHLRRFNDPFSLKYIQDIFKILEKHSNGVDWKYILKYCRLNRLDSLLYYTLISVKINMGYPVPNTILNMFYPGVLRAGLLKLFINKLSFVSVRRTENLLFAEQRRWKQPLYVVLRFLLYSRAWDFIKFVILLPEEEFSRFHSIEFPSKKASIIYTLRFLVMPSLFLNIKSSKKSSI